MNKKQTKIFLFFECDQMNIKHGTLQEKSNVSHFILLYLKDFFLGTQVTKICRQTIPLVRN